MSRETCTLVITMILVGFFGGIVSFTINKRKYLKDRFYFYDFIKSLFSGIAAALLVPLFLESIESDIIVNDKIANGKYLVFIGFCLIASISSYKFIEVMQTHVYNKFQSKLKEAENLNKQGASEADIAKATGLDPETIVNISKKVENDGYIISKAEGKAEGKAEAAKKLKKLNISNENIAKATGLDEETIKNL